MESGPKGTSRVCRGRHGEVGLVEFGLKAALAPRTRPCIAERAQTHDVVRARTRECADDPVVRSSQAQC